MYDVVPINIVRKDRHLEHHDTRLQALLPAVSNRIGMFLVYYYSDNTENILGKGDVMGRFATTIVRATHRCNAGRMFCFRCQRSIVCSVFRNWCPKDIP